MTDKPLEQRDYPIRAVGPCIYRRTASSPLAVLASRDLAADMAQRLNATLVPPAPEPTQWPPRRTLPAPLSVAETRAALAAAPTLQDVLDGKIPGVSAVVGRTVSRDDWRDGADNVLRVPLA